MIQGIARLTGKLKEETSVAKESELFYAKMEYPLRFDVYPGGELCLVMNYYKHYCVDEVIQQLLNHLKTLLKQALANPQQTTGDLMNCLK